jgi:hypothetical protein
MRSWTLLAFLAVAALVTACGANQPEQTASGSPGGGNSAEASARNPGHASVGSPGQASPGSSRQGSPGTTGSPPVASGVAGHVSAGPVTPVSRPGQPDTRPVDGARVEALRGTDVVALTSTDRAGYYQLQLAPGTYVIAVTYPGLRPSPLEKTVAVSAGQLHTLNFVLDTGIR